MPIAGASDAGTRFDRHGGVVEEAALLVRDIGLSAEQALAVVTRTAAACLGGMTSATCLPAREGTCS